MPDVFFVIDAGLSVLTNAERGTLLWLSFSSFTSHGTDKKREWRSDYETNYEASCSARLQGE